MIVKKKIADMTQFTARLRYLMEFNNLNQAEFAVKTGLSQSAVSRYLRGKLEPKLKDLITICAVMGCSFDWLAAGRGSVLGQAGSDGGLHGPHEVGDQATIYTITRCAADPDCQKICETYVQAAHQDTKEMLAAVAEIMRSGNEEVITSLKYNLITFRKAVKNDELVKSFLRRGRTKGTGKKET